MRSERSGSPSKFTFLWIVVLVTGLVLVLNYLDRVSKLVTVQSQISDLQASIRWAEQWNLQLKDELTYYASPEYVEEMARSELGFVQPGDNVLVVFESGGSSPDGGLASAQQIERLPKMARPTLFSIEWWKMQFQVWGGAANGNANLP